MAGTISDPDAGDTGTTWAYTAGEGVDAGASCSFADANAADTTVTCSDDGSYVVTLTADDGEATSSDSAMVTVVNVAPDVGAISAPSDPVAVNTAVEVSAPFSDPASNDTHTCSLEWGDATANSVVEPAASPCNASHSYSAASVYTLKMTVVDDNGGSDDATHQYVVVYDPSAGYVTGNGWIDSPPDAYTPDDPDDRCDGGGTIRVRVQIQEGCNRPRRSYPLPLPCGGTALPIHGVRVAGGLRPQGPIQGVGHHQRRR